jgi:hypothetical protein
MKVLDDCHNYEMDTFMNSGIRPVLQFYKMALDGTKVDGVTNEEVIKVLIHRLKYLNSEWQNGKFYCEENDLAIFNLEHALHFLNKRTKKRMERGVEGTHEI